MAQPKKTKHVPTDEELGVLSSGPLPAVTDDSEAWTEKSRQLAKPVPMPKVIVKQASVQSTVSGQASGTEV